MVHFDWTFSGLSHRALPATSRTFCAQVFALHPLYLSLTALAPDDMPHNLEQRIKGARVQLDKQDVDYEQTLATKLAIAREIFDHRGPAELEVLPSDRVQE
jgi:4-alpha-glucanotransferase